MGRREKKFTLLCSPLHFLYSAEQEKGEEEANVSVASTGWAQPELYGNIYLPESTILGNSVSLKHNKQNHTFGNI